MKSVKEYTSSKLQVLFTDIDDTLTDNGRLEPIAYQSLWDLYDQDIKVVPVTGRPAGWCELIARQWPVAGVVGENGGFYFCYKDKMMKRKFELPETTRKDNRNRLESVKGEVLEKVPGTAVASDQFCRLMDLAIDFCEDVKPLAAEDVEKIVEIFKKHGANAKVSSIHVNGWFGNYDKLSMCKTFCKEELGFDLSENLDQVAFVGDSPNDEPMFEYFKNSFAVSNIEKFKGQLQSLPQYVASKPGGLGFAEIVQQLLN